MILTALNNYYQRLLEQDPDNVPAYGFSDEKISYALVLSKEGKLLDIRDVRDTSGKKPAPTMMTVPQSSNRSGKVIKPFFTWDNAQYVLGVISSKDNKLDDEKKKLEESEKAQAKNEEFKRFHKEHLANSDDEVVKAFISFLGQWSADQFEVLDLTNEDMRDANFVVMLDGERSYLHTKLAVKKAWRELVQNEEAQIETCLVTGKKSAVARIHPVVKGVWGAQSSGAAIISFNKDSFESYGKIQGSNSPVSEAAAFAYTTMLNRLLQKDSTQCLHLGDVSMVFWAEANSANKAIAAENTLAAFLDIGATDESEIQKLQTTLKEVAKGRPIQELNPDLDGDTKIYVLGLAPNASRLSVRFWETHTLQRFAERLGQHYMDLSLEPLPWKTEPSVYLLLLQTVPHREGQKPKADDVPPHLAGELMRAILTGSRYPQSLLTNLIMRMRADGDISGLRVALCKAVLTRNNRLSNTNQKELPMSLDKNNTDSGYLLGRLFAELEAVQRAALGDKVNSTIRDRYFGAASATPNNVFPVLVRNAQNHLSRLRKDKPGYAVNLEKEIAEIVDKLGTSFPKNLRMEAQGHFVIGYYHQSKSHFTSNKIDTQEGEDA